MFSKLAGAFGGLLGIAFSLFCFVMGILMLFATDTFFRVLGFALAPLQVLVGVAFLICVVLGLPFLAFQKTRVASALIFLISSFLFGLHLSIASMGVIYELWGKWPFLISTLFLPFQPLIAMLALAIKGEWVAVGSVAISIVIFIGTVLLQSLADRLHTTHAFREKVAGPA